MTRWLGLAALIVTFSMGIGPAVAQTRPNFSGTWALLDPPETGGVMFVGLAFIAEQNDKTLTVTPTLHQIHRGEQPEKLRAVLSLDGSESKNPFDIHAGHGLVGTRTSRATWEAERLVIATTTGGGVNGFTQTQTWSLDPAGTLAIDEVLTVRGETRKKRAMYRRN
jgi:hypothetical protein